jgi:branched-chain amino acid transport system permease protein
LGAIIERLVFAPLRKRTRTGWVMNTFLLTVGLSFVLVNGTTLVLGPNFRGIPRYYDVPPVQFLGMRIAMDRIFAFVIAIVVIVALTYFMQRTRTGRAIRAVSQDETGAQLVGINLGSIHTLDLLAGHGHGGHVWRCPALYVPGLSLCGAQASLPGLVRGHDGWPG